MEIQMLRRNFAVCGILILILSSTANASAPLNSGLWEISMVITMSGTGKIQKPAIFQKCFNESDIKNIPSRLFNISKPDNSCTMTTRSNNDDKVSWEMSCSKEQSKISGRAHILPDGDQFSGKIELYVNIPAAKTTIPMQQDIHGRRIGDC